MAGSRGLNLLKPPRLTKGCTIGVASPSSFSEPFALGQGVNYLRKLGYKVVLGDCTRNLTRTGFASGKDDARAKELTGMFGNEDVNAVWCSRGGYGAMRILDLIEFDVIRENPKIFIGYSDITTLHVAIHQRTGLVTFHGPSIEGYGADDAEKNPPTGKENIDRALKMLSTAEPWGKIENPPDGMLLRTISSGSGSGPIIGGNLSMLTHTLGTDDSVQTDGRILFLEDTGVSEYDVERLLVHMQLARKLDKVKGIVLGQVSHFHKRGEPTPSLEEVIQERIGSMKDVPSFTGLCCGHGRIKLIIPEGVRAKIDADEPSLRITESPLAR